MSDDKFEAKFTHLLKEVTKKYEEKQLKSFEENEKKIQNSLEMLFENINNKFLIKCKDKLDKINAFAEFNKKLFENVLEDPIKELKPTPGYEKEFDQAKNELIDCKNEFSKIIEEIQVNSASLQTLIYFSTQNCVLECKKDVKKEKLSEKEATKCLETCMRYHSYNNKSFITLINDEIKQKELFLEKL